MSDRKRTSLVDGPSSPLFRPVAFRGNTSFVALKNAAVSAEMKRIADRAPSCNCVSWGIPFRVNRAILAVGKPVTVRVAPIKTQWLVFLHAADWRLLPHEGDPSAQLKDGRPFAERIADYVVVYADGREERIPIRQRREIGMCIARWGEEPLESVNHHKPFPVGDDSEKPWYDFGAAQTKVRGGQRGPWVNTVWAWANPRPSQRIVALRIEPLISAVVISGISAGNASAPPLRWRTRRKALLTLPRGTAFDPSVDEQGRLSQIRLDMGQVISAKPRTVYPERDWPKTYNNLPPRVSDHEILVEYASHPDARFHLPGGRMVPVSALEGKGRGGPLVVVPPATERVTLRVVEKDSGKEVPVKLHVHGRFGEYLAPVDRHRIPNGNWFEDYSVDFVADSLNHYCTYIPGRTVIDLPVGAVYIEVSKGFEIKPVRRVVKVTRGRREITIELDKVLHWREMGWVTADTHVHFLSPQTALLEGAGEGVNVTNLLASQWGELMTNVGDFDGHTTIGSRESGGDGEYLVRVGTENRQYMLGHISLLGYSGDIIAPMTTGGPEEAAIGDPVGALLTEWARQCKNQGGVVVLPHFPFPRCEHAATIVSGLADAVELNSHGRYGIYSYSLADWYRYLNCGYQMAAVGGTDKMSTARAVGLVRTYAKIDPRRTFTYDSWKDAIRRGNTFVTFGPLLEFSVDGRPMGSRLRMTASGGAVDVEWEVGSCTIPMTRVDLMVNGDIRESRTVRPWADRGSWSVKLDRSSWLAILVRGRQGDKPEGVMAHSSTVMVDVARSRHIAAADAVTILDHIEGALAYIDTIGTRAETRRYKQMRLILTGAYRTLHNRMHQAGLFHDHLPVSDRPEHH